MHPRRTIEKEIVQIFFGLKILRPLQTACSMVVTPLSIIPLCESFLSSENFLNINNNQVQNSD